MSKVIEDSGAYHIVRVIERVEAGRQPFSAVQSEITEKIREQRFQTRLAEYLQRLRTETYVWTNSGGEVMPSQYAVPVDGPMGGSVSP
jgi:parvulin-like peptidyl-prolyl isomerase